MILLVHAAVFVFFCTLGAAWLFCGAYVWWLDFGDIFTERPTLSFDYVFSVLAVVFLLACALVLGPFSVICASK